MNTYIIFSANYKVGSVSDEINELKHNIANYVGTRFIKDNETGLTASVLSTTLSSEEKSQITDFANDRNIGVLFIESEYNPLNGSTLIWN